MNLVPDGAVARACWFVGAAYGGTNDQTTRFLDEGIWENGYKDKLLDVVKSIQPGDRIAIKSSYTRKRRDNLPFDNRGHTVSVMAIKAIGTVIENPGDGRIVRVDWTRFDTPHEWYFFTNRGTIWRVVPGSWLTDALIGFAFDNKPQDRDRFRNAPYWRERFGDAAADKKRFSWTPFYEAVADKLLVFKSNRAALIEGIRAISEQVGELSYLHDKFADGTTGPIKDICPFTTMGIFNRGISVSNRKAIAAELANFLGVEEPVPESFEGIPTLNNQKSCFFSFENKRNPNDINTLWDIFSEAIRFADSKDPEERSDFAKAYDNATQVFCVGWNLTMGLYWIRPWDYPTLDGQSQLYINKKLGIKIGLNGPKRRCNSVDYLAVLEMLETRFKEEDYPVHSFPSLSLAAWDFKDTAVPLLPEVDDQDIPLNEQIVTDILTPINRYSIGNMLTDGCFLDIDVLNMFLERLRSKKNLIIQGAPGTGKTWLAKRLAYALIGQKDESKVRAVQFHPNLSYEDFVRGWRPCIDEAGNGKLTLVDGVFLQAIKAAMMDPSSSFVVVIEEINRGNPAQIFGELLTLLEAGKRTPNEALELCYPDADGNRRVHIPENLFVIGTMNIADRSLALVDLALRRRFAFVTLKPKMGERWRDWVIKECNVDADLAMDIERRINDLNDHIADRHGEQFRIGHSYVTPTCRLEDGETQKWFKQVVETDIGPLLEEYWFDAPKEAKEACERLVKGWL